MASVQVIGLILTFCLATVLAQRFSGQREQRAVFYLNNPRSASCQGRDARDGYCLLHGCRLNQLQENGRCMYGLASCCTAELSCGSRSNVNNTYFTNPLTTAIGSCEMHIDVSLTGACQVRLDFEEFELEQPNHDGICQTDAFTVEGSKNVIPTLCGSNKGQHVYLEVDETGQTPIKLSVTINEVTLSRRKWNIKITHIPCQSPVRATRGCLQYHFGKSGLVQSFNFGRTQLASTTYSTCIRQEEGFCSLSWSKSAIDGDKAFTVSGDTRLEHPAQLGTEKLAKVQCEDDFVLIPEGKDHKGEVAERICGLGFPYFVKSHAKPFVLYTKTGPSELGDYGNVGFSLRYKQDKCI